MGRPRTTCDNVSRMTLWRREKRQLLEEYGEHHLTTQGINLATLSPGTYSKPSNGNNKRLLVDLRASKICPHCGSSSLVPEVDFNKRRYNHCILCARRFPVDGNGRRERINTKERG